MVNWIKDIIRPKIKTMFSKIKDVPENMWVPCPKCSTLMYRKDLHNHLNVCPKCDYHLFLQVNDRFDSLFDDAKYQIIDAPKVKEDPINFKDLKKYKDRLELLYLDIQDSSKEESHWSNWFDENKETLEIEKILENAELLKFVFNGYKMRKKHIKPYTEYIKTINAIIEARGKVLAEKLMKKP